MIYSCTILTIALTIIFHMKETLARPSASTTLKDVWRMPKIRSNRKTIVFDKFVHKRQRRRILSAYLKPEMYPLLGAAACAHNYLKLTFLCDPDAWLSHADARKIEATLRKAEKFQICDSHLQHAPLDFELPPYTYSIGIALTNELQYSDSENCQNNKNGDKFNGDIRYYDIRREMNENAMVNIFLKRAARSIHRRWLIDNNLLSNPDCSPNIFVLAVRSFIVCLNNKTIVYRKSRESPFIPHWSLSFGADVKSHLNEDLIIRLLDKEAENLNHDSSANLNTPVLYLSRLITVLNAVLQRTTRNQDHYTNITIPKNSYYHDMPNKFSFNERQKRGPFPRKRKHVIPTWALIAGTASIAVSFFAFLLGQWINGNSGMKSRFGFSDKHHSGNRRWRAGFAAGMVEMRGGFSRGSGTSRPYMSGIGGFGKFGGGQRTGGGGMPLRLTITSLSAVNRISRAEKSFGGFGATTQRRRHGFMPHYRRVV